MIVPDVPEKKSKVSKKASTKKEEKSAHDLNDVDGNINEENVATKEQPKKGGASKKKRGGAKI